MQDLTRLQKLVQLPPIQEALKDKFSRFDEELNPTHDQQGNELEPKVISLWQPLVDTSFAEVSMEAACCHRDHVVQQSATIAANLTLQSPDQCHSCLV